MPSQPQPEPLQFIIQIATTDPDAQRFIGAIQQSRMLNSADNEEGIMIGIDDLRWSFKTRDDWPDARALRAG
jgi:hypothetical protein